MPGNERLLFAVALAQGGEFGFVLFSFARLNGVLPQPLTETLISVVAISMFLAPLLFLLHDRLIAPRLEHAGVEQQADDIENGGHSVILAGFGRLDTDLGRLLISAGIKPVILDHNEAYKIRRLFRKKDKDSMPELYRIQRQDEDKNISMYHQHNADLAELMKKDREIDMAELDKAWTTANPET